MIVINKTPQKKELPAMIQILVVEDESIIALNLKENLEALGYAVVGIAASGEKAVEKARRLHPNLVLMDIQLKGRMDGIQAAQQIWESLSIPVIYVTGHSDSSTLERATITAPFGYVLKPVKEKELSVAISIALQRYQREQLLNAILRGMGDGVIVVNQENRIQSLNKVAESLTGWQVSEARERELTEVFPLIDERTQEPIDNPVTAVFQQDTILYLQENTLLVSKDGTTIPIGDSIAPIKDNKGVLAGAVLVFRDISVHKQVEQAIREQLEKEQRLNQVQNQFIRTVSHEYRTPLSVILTCSQLLESNVDQLDPEKQLRNCRKIQNSVKYMVGLIENVWLFKQVEDGQQTFNPICFDLQQFCQQLVEQYQLITNEGKTIQLICPGEHCTAYLDEKFLRLILGNLLSNALKYSPNDSTISLRITDETNRVIFQVRDWGMGIPLEDQIHIFEPFYRAANVKFIRGTGMGLAIVKKAVELQGGEISVESQVGIGTTFTVSLPTISREPETDI
ncbi:MAG TPA: ATP-binding protein [Coleofasciculaceae cyanobacterium]